MTSCRFSSRIPMTARLRDRSSAVCLLPAISRADATRSNSALTRDLICSAHSIWLGVPVIFPLSVSGPLTSGILFPAKGELLLDMTGVCGNAHVAQSQKRARRYLVNFDAVALLQAHGHDDSL